jgi:hypothetical protein
MQFKKHIALFLAFFVLVSNVGFALNVHYCDDQIASVSFNTAAPSYLEEDCCGIVEKTSHCCKDRIVVLQKKSDQAIVKSFSLQLNEAVLTQQWQPIIQTVQFLSQNTNVPAYYCDSHAPPRFKLYSQYIFYDLI